MMRGRRGKIKKEAIVCVRVSVIVIDLRLGRGASCHREEKVTCREGPGVSIKAGKSHSFLFACVGLGSRCPVMITCPDFIYAIWKVPQLALMS
jgi:hypothetical protein